VGEGLSLALLLGVAGEVLRRRTTGKGGGGRNPRRGQTLHAREFLGGGAVRWPAASTGRPAEEARARVREENLRWRSRDDGVQARRVRPATDCRLGLGVRDCAELL
jgi:hypothetical protein